MANILFICGSLNQMTQMHQVARHFMDEHECYFTPYYGDGIVNLFAKMAGWISQCWADDIKGKPTNIFPATA